MAVVGLAQPAAVPAKVWAAPQARAALLVKPEPAQTATSLRGVVPEEPQR